MKRLIPVFLFAPTAAFAHAGDHAGLSVRAVPAHFAAQPDHAALIVAALGVAALGVTAWLRQRKVAWLHHRTGQRT